MAIEAKASFLRMAEKKLSTEVTAETMSKVLSIMADVMEGFADFGRMVGCKGKCKPSFRLCAKCASAVCKFIEKGR